MKRNVSAWSIAALMVACFGSAQAQPAVDTAAAEALMKKSGCNKCHSLSAKKEGPPYKETAAKYKGKADGEEKLTKAMTTGPKVKLDDGTEEEHKIIKTKDAAELKNLAQWILSR